MTRFGLIGKSLGHSFSKDYHNTRFSKEGVDARYDNYELESAAQVTDLFAENPSLKGVNVTAPYKREVMDFLDLVDPLAQEVQAVNTIVRTVDGLKGFNTDLFGFTKSLQDWLGQATVKALVLGSGGASKAVQCALNILKVEYLLVSRNPSIGQLSYQDLNDEVLDEHHLLINLLNGWTFRCQRDANRIVQQAVGQVDDAVRNRGREKE